jgi:RimJ/RimL family protein N-acetyltransferase
MAENIFLETERLILRRFTMDDVDHIAALDGDPERVMRCVADGLPKMRRDAEEGVSRVLLNYEKFPCLGLWITEGKPRLAFVGWVWPQIHSQDR